MKNKETLEETYLDNLINEANKEFTLDRKLAKEVAIKFSKFSKPKMYSEEEVKKQLNLILTMKNSLLDTFTNDEGFITDKWFEKFKKK